ncbi:hypothetical protein CD122_10925 [Staphylococcus rostri]|uniref:Uncharacterized protein n=1 Tax=Staphylococcus rostri TaxID=522262 RepID=A0A2K3YH26_9STAP|nr:hypothetical protein [Staphylococcus rostri]PNZ24538.1 hypothetical protein CD122_10925 [Staphylococcus rostri]
MPKIKVKKQVGLEELLNLLSNDEIEQGEYRGSKGTYVYLDSTFLGDFEIEGFKAGDAFEIEVEKEINERAKIDNLVGLYELPNGNRHFFSYIRCSIARALDIERAHDKKNLSFYVIESDGNMHLIWKEGNFVG